MKVQILGTGCAKCTQLAENAGEAVSGLGLDCEIVKVSDLSEIVGFGVMTTPALALDGDVKSMGRLLSVEEIKAILS